MAKTATRPARNCRGRRNLTLWCPSRDPPAQRRSLPARNMGSSLELWHEMTHHEQSPQVMCVTPLPLWSPHFCRRNRYPPLNASSSIPKGAQFQRETDTGFDTAEVAVYTTHALVARNKTTAINRISHDKTVSPPVRCQIKVRSLPRQGKARQFTIVQSLFNAT